MLYCDGKLIASAWSFTSQTQHTHPPGSSAVALMWEGDDGQHVEQRLEQELYIGKTVSLN